MTPQQICEAYKQGKIVGAWTDNEGVPSDCRREARYQMDQWLDEAERPLFADYSDRRLYGDWRGQLCVPYTAHFKTDPTNAFKERQLTGDCVSVSKRSATDKARSYEQIVEGRFIEYQRRGCSAWYYSFRGHTGQGASPTRLARVAVENGILLEGKYTSPDGEEWDLTSYDSYYKIGMKYGRSGFPEWLRKHAEDKKQAELAVVKSDEELLTALWNGCGTSVGSQLGASSRGGKDGVAFLSAIQGSWNHDMQILGFDDRKKYHKETLIIWDQTWGNWNQISGWPEEYGPKPEGAFVLTLSDTMRYAVSRGECHAISGTQGFRPQRLPDFGATGLI